MTHKRSISRPCVTDACVQPLLGTLVTLCRLVVACLFLYVSGEPGEIFWDIPVILAPNAERALYPVGCSIRYRRVVDTKSCFTLDALRNRATHTLSASGGLMGLRCSGARYAEALRVSGQVVACSTFSFFARFLKTVCTRVLRFFTDGRQSYGQQRSGTREGHHNSSQGERIEIAV